MNRASLAAELRNGRGFRHKRDISDVVTALGRALPSGANNMNQAVAVGDDCAAIPDGDGYLLFAIEGLVEDFIITMPWFAGYSSVMVNVSDVYAMGGRPIAVVDALWSKGMEPGGDVLRGMAAASAAYAVPIVGGHSNNQSDRGQLVVAILGRAKALLTSFAARPGDVLLTAIDLRGAFEEPFPFWNAATRAPDWRWRADLEILPLRAESGLCDAAKDISMAGAFGTALMLLECSNCGAEIDPSANPIPANVALNRWLTAFPSFGFVLSVRPEKAPEARARFAARDIACSPVGVVTEGTHVLLKTGADNAMLWDFADDAFIMAQSLKESLHA